MQTTLQVNSQARGSKRLRDAVERIAELCALLLPGRHTGLLLLAVGAGLGTVSTGGHGQQSPAAPLETAAGQPAQLIARPDADLSQQSHRPPVQLGQVAHARALHLDSQPPQLRSGRTPPVEAPRTAPESVPQPQTEQAAQQARQNRIYENFHVWVLFPIVSGLIGLSAGWCIGRWCYYAANRRTTKLLFP